MNDVKVFVSYSHQDTEHVCKEGLLGFLYGLQDDTVSFWVDDQLAAGDKWDDTIRDELQRCDIALILVSQAFLDSQYCIDIEISSFLDRCRNDGLKIFPVVLSACEWDQHPWLSDYQMLPGGNETIEEDYIDPGKRKRLFLTIRKNLRAMIEQVKENKSQNIVQAPQPQSHAERRTVTLVDYSLSVDLKRYGFDAEDQLEFLYEAAPKFKESCFGKIEMLGGYFVDMDNSGNATICFGYPLARENDSLNAVRAALSILQLIEVLNQELEKEWNARLSIQIGVHTGLVIGKTGADTQQQLSRGNTANIAAQIKSTATLDSVAISEHTYRLVNDFFDTDFVKTLAGSEPIDVWEITADKGLNSRFEASIAAGLTALVGRQQEFSIIIERWQQARKGKGHLILVSSEAGLGKSRLIHEVKSTVTAEIQSNIQANKIAENPAILICQCSQFHQNSALYPIIKTLNQWLKIDDCNNDDEKLEAIITATQFLGDGAEEIIVLVAEFLTVSYEGNFAVPEYTPQQLKDHMFDAVLALLIERCNLNPVLLIVEDLHWMDASSLEWVDRLLEEIPSSQLLCLCSARPEFTIPEHWHSVSHYVPIKLYQLSKTQVQEMVTELAHGKPFPTEIFNDIYNKTDGSPLFVEELTEMVLESGLLEEQNGVLVTTRKYESLAIPDTLQEVLMARLSRLEGGKLIAQIGAVIGREFPYALIKAIAPIDEATLKEALGRLIDAGLLNKRGLLSRASYIFKHALIQDTLYDSLLRRERKRYHQNIGSTIEDKFSKEFLSQPEVLAHHFTEAGDTKKALKYGIDACELSFKELANNEAIANSNKVLAILEKLPVDQSLNEKELRVLKVLGPALLAVKGWSSPEIGKMYLRSRELCQEGGNINEIFQATRGLWGFYMVSSQLKKSLDICQELLLTAEVANNNSFFIEAYTTFCDSYFWKGNTIEAQHNAELGLALYDFDTHHESHSSAYGEDPSSIMLCYSCISLWLLGKTDESEEVVTYIIENYKRYSNFSRGFLVNGLAWYFVHRQNIEEALKYGEELKSFCIEKDVPAWLPIANTQVGWANAAKGDIDGGAADILLGMGQWKAGGSVVTIGLSYSMLVDGYLRAERYDDAIHYIEEGLEHIESAEEKHYYSELLRQKAEVLVHTNGDAAEIENLYEQSLKFTCEKQLKALEKRTLQSYETIGKVYTHASLSL